MGAGISKARPLSRRKPDEPDGREHHARRGRRGEAVEAAGVAAGRHVEAREPERGARGVQEREHPAGPAELLERAGAVGQDGRRHAERDGVGDRVVLAAEAAGRARESRDAAVERVEERREHDDQRGALDVALERERDRVEAGREIARGEELRQQLRGAPPLIAPPAPPARAPHAAFFDVGHEAHAAPPGSSATTELPPRTRSPFATRARLPAGSTTSVREPKRISP